MNKTLKTFAIALGLGLATSVQAQIVTFIDNPGYIAKIATVPNTNSIKVYVGNIENQKLVFKIRDASRNVLFMKRISKNEPQALMKLNLDDLQDGIYNIELSDNNSKTVKSYKKETTNVVTKPIYSLLAIN